MAATNWFSTPIPCRAGRIARWMLEEVGAPYRTEILNYAASMKAPEYLAINPMGKVPAIKHGDDRGDRGRQPSAPTSPTPFPRLDLAPPLGDKARGPYFRWLFFAAGPVEAATTNASLGVQATGRQEDDARLRLYGRCAERAGDRRRAKPTSSRETSFTAADVYFGSQIGFGMQFQGIEKRPCVRTVLGADFQPSRRHPRPRDRRRLIAEQCRKLMQVRGRALKQAGADSPLPR